MIGTIPVLRPQLPAADAIQPYLRRIDETRVYSNFGPLTSEFEARIAASANLMEDQVTSAASGLAALVGAILSTAGRATPDRPFALIPSYTFVANATAVESCGYVPYLVDIDQHTLQLDPHTLSAHPLLDQVGIVVPVAAFGAGVPQIPWIKFRSDTGIPVVIDGAASFENLIELPAKFVGSIPVAVSFHATKSFGIGEGGCIVSTDSDVTARCAASLNYGFSGVRDCRSPNTNGKMSEYHAAVGLAEFDGWYTKHAALLDVASSYLDSFAAAQIGRKCIVAPAIASCYALVQASDRTDAETICVALASNMVEFRLWYGLGIHSQTYYIDLPRDELRVTDRAAPCLIGLPVAPDLSRSDIDVVSNSIRLGVSASGESDKSSGFGS